MDEPLIERPDERQVQTTDMFCYRDANRPCDSTCVAFLVVLPEGADYAEQEWSRCHLLVNEHRQGKHLTVIAQVGSALLKHLHVRAADISRAAGAGVL